MATLFLSMGGPAYAAFDWGGDGTCSGSGAFEQPISRDATVEVGQIPVGLTDVYIELSSDKDVDIQLYDEEDGTRIVHWPDGILNDVDQQSTEYNGVSIEWSGYRGDGLNPGNEYIRIGGVTNRSFIMKAYGFQAGTATVDYSWAGAEDCEDEGICAGSGSFEQRIEEDDIFEIGEIPVGKEGVFIRLQSDEDIDIQLYDKATDEKIVHWPDGILNDSTRETAPYHGVTVEWSGYNGDGSGPGNEYIRLTGTTDRPLVMKAYGFKAGLTTVTYSWTGTEGCTPADGEDGDDGESEIPESGSETVDLQIVEDGVAEVGELAAGMKNVYVEVACDGDVDIQLFDAGNNEKIVYWPDGILAGPKAGTTPYNGVTVEWSGYDGDGTGPGNEYLKLTGTLGGPLMMKVYGYKAGEVTVTYSWGNEW